MFQDESRVDIDCRNSDGLTPLLLVTRDVQFFEKLGERMNEGYDPTQVIAELLDHDAYVYTLVLNDLLLHLWLDIIAHPM